MEIKIRRRNGKIEKKKRENGKYVEKRDKFSLLVMLMIYGHLNGSDLCGCQMIFFFVVCTVN